MLQKTIKLIHEERSSDSQSINQNSSQSNQQDTQLKPMKINAFENDKRSLYSDFAPTFLNNNNSKKLKKRRILQKYSKQPIKQKTKGLFKNNLRLKVFQKSDSLQTISDITPGTTKCSSYSPNRKQRCSFETRDRQFNIQVCILFLLIRSPCIAI